MKYNRKRWAKKYKYSKYRILNAFQAQYKDPRWLSYRKQILERDGFQCAECGCRAKKGSPLHVHHLKYYGKHIWDVEPQDLVTLCKPCHNAAHGREF